MIPSTGRQASNLWLIIPAAGVGSRMQADRPKQYLPLNGRPIIEHTLQRLAVALPLAELVICMTPDDPALEGYSQLCWSFPA